MLNPDFPRDLLTIGVVFGLAALVWAGWAQERPPSARWRVALGILSALGIGLVVAGVPAVIGSWETGTALEPGTPAFIGYVVSFWTEVILGVVGAIVLIRRRRRELVPALILAIVGVHFVPLAFVFGQGILVGAAVLLCAAAAVAFRARATWAPSFSCGILAAPVFVLLGLWSLVAGLLAVG